MRAPLVVGVLALAGGIALGAQRSVPLQGGPFAVFTALTAAGMALYLTRAGGRRDGRYVLGLLAVAGVLLGIGVREGVARSCASWLPPDLPLRVFGRSAGAAGGRFTLALDSVELGRVRVRCKGTVAASVEGDLPSPGAEVTGRGRWWRPAGSAGGLRPGGLLLLDALDAVEPEGRGPGALGRMGGLLDAVRAGARGRVDGLFGDRAPLAASLLLAQRDGLDREVRDRFARAGLSHLLAISGLHVALIAGILLVLAGALRMGRTGGSVAAGLVTLGYVGFLGAPHSATRAALQILLVLAGRVMQRPARTEAIIASAALLLLAAGPGALFSPGFQLSFAGVAGILAFRRPLLRGLDPLARARTGPVKVAGWLADGLATSIAATVATAPIVAWHFGRVAPVGIAANLVAIPLLSVTVPALAAALASSLVWAPAGRFLAGAGIALLDSLDAVARWAASVPGGTVTVPASMALVLTGAAVAGGLASRRLGRTRRWVRGVVWAGTALTVVLVSPVRPVGDRVEIHVIDVGQGDAIAIRSPAGRWLLVDAGVATDSYDAGARQVVPYLGRRGVQRLEGLILTHPDADHTGGATAVVAALRPRWIGDPGRAAPKAGYLTLLEVAADRGVPWVAFRRGMELDVDGMLIQVLHPAGENVEDANDASIVLRLVFGEFQALLTGDAPTAVEQALVLSYGRGLEADVLKVGHHGSSTSTSRDLLEASGVRVALISAGQGNRYGHPHRSVLRRLEAAGLIIGRTDRHGTLVVRGARTGEVWLEGRRLHIAP